MAGVCGGLGVTTFDHRDPVPDSIVCIFFVDTAYGFEEDEAVLSNQLKAELEIELGVELEEVDIGPGAALPAWLFTLDLGAVAVSGAIIALFFQGRRIEENIEAWSNLACRIRGLLNREVALNRSAAAILAVDEVVQVSGANKPSVRLIDYRWLDSRFERFEDDTGSIDPARMEYHGYIVHVFELDIDGERYLAVVEGKDVAVKKVG
jgi:hypothetical protein